jgi:hypothetical protein
MAGGRWCLELRGHRFIHLYSAPIHRFVRGDRVREYKDKIPLVLELRLSKMSCREQGGRGLGRTDRVHGERRAMFRAEPTSCWPPSPADGVRAGCAVARHRARSVWLR